MKRILPVSVAAAGLAVAGIVMVDSLKPSDIHYATLDQLLPGRFLGPT